MAAKSISIPIALQNKFSDPDWGADQLQVISVFKNFTKDELQSLYVRGNVKIVKAGSHIVIEGEPTRGLYLIFSGSVSVFKNDTSTGAMHRLAHLSEGAVFGEMSLFDNSPRSATVKADSISYIFELGADTFETFLDENGDSIKARFFKTCAEDLSVKFRTINADYISAQQLLWKYAFRKNNKPA